MAAFFVINRVRRLFSSIQDSIETLCHLLYNYNSVFTRIVTTNDSLKAVFDTYSVFELGSANKLKLSKSKGLWLGGWSGRLNPSIVLEWTSSMIKVLGVFFDIGIVKEANWRPQMVENTLNSWRQRHLSYHGRALIINALALSWICYVASLVHMPVSALCKLNTLIFNFF